MATSPPTRLVAKLAAARKRKRQASGKCEGRKSLAETNPEAVALAKRLARKKPKGFASELTPASARWAFWRFRRGLSARSIAQFR